MPRRVPTNLDATSFDLIVVGAGINGAGIARDAVIRGLRVLLLDKGDIASGTTSWSTRLIHGGLRYLEHREVGLVRESLREREVLMRIAPHLVRPLEFMIPIYRGDERGPRLIRLGMVAYDALSMDKSLERHRMLTAAETLEREPGLNPRGLRGGAFYFDAQAEYPERLAVENALDARRQGAVVVPYAEVESLMLTGNRVCGVRFRDVFDGAVHQARGALVVNASGPWADHLLRDVDGAGPPRIGGTKGSHLVVGPFPGAPKEALYIEAEDGRPYFVVPWNGLFLIGTTDRRYTGDLDRVVADDEEIEYLISETNAKIPGAGLSRDSVLYTYSGVRPLPHVTDVREGGITRRHIIEDHAENDPRVAGLVTIIGGKITTYRSLAEQTVDRVFAKLGRRSPKCRTGELPLPGGAVQDFDAFRAQFIATSGVPRPAAERLLRIYGSRAVEVLDVVADDPDLLQPLDPETGAIRAEVLFAFRAELAQGLDDLLLRRTMVGYNSHVAIGADEAAAEVARRHLAWDEDRAREEVERYRRAIARYRPRDLRAATARRPRRRGLLPRPSVRGVS
jgi:glycerol-3-phosphate dehydrogenase